ncbi:MAG TPA: efflux RND transporter permease subunit [Puia sp.]|nr:efflux RND transporter permease subunit [Puia sp.]
MSLVSAGLKKPVAIIVVTMGVLLFSVLAIFTIPIDIFPRLNLPTIYVIEPYGGMSPRQMEGFFATRMQDQFLYVNGIKNIESKNIQGISIIKLSFYETTDMAEASAQVALQVNRASAFFPPGALPPQVVRFDASSLPVGELVFSSPTRSLKDVYDLALTRVRPMFATVPGLSAPPPFGSNARSVVINIDPDKIRSYNLSPDEVVGAIAKNNSISPSGNLRINNTMYITTLNSLEEKVEAFDDIPVVTSGNTTIFVHDIGKVSDAADITVDYALVNGRRSVYIPVVKTSDASTWDVVKGLKSKLPEIQTLLPEDTHVTYEFDQSVFVINAVKSLITEGILGAVLTGLMVLLFLQDLRSSLIVIITIPVSVLSAVMLLRLAGQTINIMTLSGLALAIGVLVDQATVTIENIHQHLEMGKPKRQAIYDACEEIAFPLLLILLCILAVFAPAIIMTGVPRAMFLPLSLSIGFAMIASYFLAQALVPVLANWMLKAEKFMYRHGHKHAHAGLALDKAEVDEVGLHTRNEQTVPEKNDRFERFKMAYHHVIQSMMSRRRITVAAYFIIVLGLTGLAFYTIGKDLMPKVNTGQFQLRIKEPGGTRLEITESRLHEVLHIIDTITDGHVAISSAFAGPVPTNFGSSNLYVFNSGTHEGILQVNLDEKYKVDIDDLKDAIRKKIRQDLPEMNVSFEPMDLTEKIMSQGAATPIEVRVAGRDMKQIGDYAGRLVTEMQKITWLRDVQIAQPLKVPVININVDRFKAAQMGMSLADVARSVTAATSSSRYTQKNLWLDDRTSYTYQVQVQVPEYIMHELSDLKEVPLITGQSRPVLEDLASFAIDTIPGEYDRAGPRRYVTVSANIYKKDLGATTTAVQRAIKDLGDPPRGLVTEIQGTSSLLIETLGGLQNGLGIAIVVIFLLLAANYQSFKLSLAVLTTVPAVILGSLTALLVTGSTLNLQSYMGMIMSTGVSVANAILIVTNAEKLRLEYKDATRAAVTSASIRLRPILMTSLAMIAGMIPMASGMGEAGDQTAPLGRAVIGGLLFSTLSALLVLPQVYSLIQGRTNFSSPSLMPEDNHQ